MAMKVALSGGEAVYEWYWARVPPGRPLLTPLIHVLTPRDMRARVQRQGGKGRNRRHETVELAKKTRSRRLVHHRYTLFHRCARVYAIRSQITTT